MHLALKGVKKMPVPFERADILGAVSAVICLLRGVNVVGNNKIKMEELRNLCETNGLLNVTTYVQSGNVVFRVKGRGVATLASRIEKAIEAKCGFQPHVMLRTIEELRDVVARNPFAKRANIDPSKLLVYFLKSDPLVRLAIKLAPSRRILRSYMSPPARCISTISTESGNPSCPWDESRKRLGLRAPDEIGTP
jgi:uncharacterized protein (DUF1697 family)